MNDLRKIAAEFFTSRVRLSIMRLFFTHPNEEFHMRNIARLLDEQINAVRRELVSMETTGFLKTHQIGIKKYFKLNQDFPFYADFRGIAMKSYALGYYIYDAKNKLGDVKYAVLSHTYISCETSDKDNLDLLIVGDPNFEVLEDCVRKAEQEEKKEIYYTVLTEKDFEIRKKRQDALIYSLVVLPRGMIIGKDESFVI